jgi:cell division protein FtsX
MSLKAAAEKVVRQYRNQSRMNNGVLYTAIVELEDALKLPQKTVANIVVNIDKAEMQRAIDAALEAVTDGKTVYTTDEWLAKLDKGNNFATICATNVGDFKRKCILVVLP